MTTSAQIRAGRALLGWSQSTLAEKAGLTRRTLTNIENGQRAADNTINELRRALESAGVVFLDTSAGSGVLLGAEPFADR
jgi:transcriptional regulator with XRE-family HTH domain